jgi:lipid II:glycine glycyltransferase (peptidoglycan interpeptide bridge formation enzyme)
VKDDSTTRLAAMVLRKPLPLGQSLFYCPEGPIVSGGDWRDRRNQQAFQALTDHLKKLAKRERAIFFKIDPFAKTEGFPLDWLGQLGFRDSPEDIQPAVVAQVDLTPPEDQILANMKQKGRYNIRYAQRKGVEVTFGTGDRELADFFGLVKQTAQRQGITYRSEQYFKTFQKYFMSQSDSAKFIVARYNGKPAAAILVTLVGDKADYLYGGSSAEDRNVFASYLVQWVGMQEAKRAGAKVYNLTGIAHADDPSNPWYGLRQFKLKFGPKIVDLIGAYDQAYAPARYFLFTNAERVRRRLAKLSGRARLQ